MATVSNLAIDQGTTYSVTIQVADDAGDPRDISNYTGRAQIKRSYYTNTNTAFTVNISAPYQGEITMTLTDAQTSALKAGRYVYDLELVNTTNNAVERVLEGIITVYPEVTK